MNHQRNQDLPTENKIGRPQVVFITGMHRSGSSALSRAMTTLGIHHSTNLMNASEDNKKGYWEDNDFISFNDDLLRRTGQLWEEPKLIKTDELLMLAEEKASEASSLLKDKIENKRITCLKDPRLCNLAPFWKQICKINRTPYHFIASYRDPLSTAISIQIRDSINAEKALSMWCTYYINLLESVNSGELKLVNFDKLLTETRHEIQLLSDFLGQQILEEEFKIYSEQFLDINLRHNHQSLAPETPIEVVSSKIKSSLDSYNIKATPDERKNELDLASLRNSLIQANRDLSDDSSASKFKDLFAVHYKKSEELNAIQVELQKTRIELERIKSLRKAARKRYSETIEQFNNLTKTIWWKAASPLRLILSSQRDRSNLRALNSRTKAESKPD